MVFWCDFMFVCLFSFKLLCFLFYFKAIPVSFWNSKQQHYSSHDSPAESEMLKYSLQVIDFLSREFQQAKQLHRDRIFILYMRPPAMLPKHGKVWLLLENNFCYFLDNIIE